jgi:hypothetical protein
MPTKGFFEFAFTYWPCPRMDRPRGWYGEIVWHSRRPRILVATAALGLWMWARQLRESASSSLLLELTAPLNSLTLTPHAPELECCVSRRVEPGSSYLLSRQTHQGWVGWSAKPLYFLNGLLFFYRFKNAFLQNNYYIQLIFNHIHQRFTKPRQYCIIKINYNIFRSLKLTYVASPIMIWSSRSIFNILPARLSNFEV